MTSRFLLDRPVTITAEFVRERYQALFDRIEPAEASNTADEWFRLRSDWDELWQYLIGETSRASHAFSKHMDDPDREAADRFIREEIAPISSRGVSRMIQALLNSRHREAIAERYGAFMIRTLESDVDPVAPVNSDLRVEAGRLWRTYAKMAATAEVDVMGESHTLQAARGMTTSPDRDRRRHAFLAVRGWHVEHRDEIAGIFDRLVALRTQMGRNLGYENFIPLGYSAMGRIDYGSEELTRFRENIRRYAVPLLNAVCERQREALGVDTLRPWDVAYDPELTLPPGIVPVDSQLDGAGRVFRRLSPRLADHFDRMRREGLIDLENRRAKRGGAYCTSFPDEGRAAILCNSTGNATDVRTLMHEMGHAFQKWESMDIEPLVLQSPTIDVAEIHSTGMEFLSMPLMTEFFSEEHAEKFRRDRWRSSINRLCSMAAGDEFQHWIYANPDATRDERDDAWIDVSARYRPSIDYSGYEAYQRCAWYEVPHFFGSPFYYIDYAIADVGAMQLALVDAEDHERAMNTYMDLCRMGGTRGVLDVFASAGMRPPFDEQLMQDLMRHAAEQLGVPEGARA